MLCGRSWYYGQRSHTNELLSMAAQDQSGCPTEQENGVASNRTLPKKLKPPSTADAIPDSSGYGSCSARQLLSSEVRIAMHTRRCAPDLVSKWRATTPTRRARAVRLSSFERNGAADVTMQCDYSRLRLLIEETATDV